MGIYPTTSSSSRAEQVHQVSAFVPAQGGSSSTATKSYKKEPTPVMVYESEEKQEKQAGSKQHLSDTEAGEGNLGGSFTDSAYQSMATTQDEASEIGLNDTPSKRKRARTSKLAVDSPRAPSTTPTKKRNRGQAGAEESEDELAAPFKTPKLINGGSEGEQLVPEEANGPSNEPIGLEESNNVQSHSQTSPPTRSSARTRKKSQKQIEAEQVDNVVVEVRKPRASSRVASEGGTPVAKRTPARRAARTPGSNATSKTTPKTKGTKSPATSTVRRKARPPRNQVSVIQAQPEPTEVFFKDIPQKKQSGKDAVSGQAKVGDDVEELDETMFDDRDPREDPVPMELDTAVTHTRQSTAALDDIQTVKPGLQATITPQAESQCKQRLDELTLVLEDPANAAEWKSLRDQVLSRLAGRSRLPLVGSESEYSKVFSLVEKTIVAGEGNSMMVIGSRGSAKSTLVETVVSEMLRLHKDDFHTIRLNGFIHTDDKIALKEIWRQLGREMDIEDEVNGRNNYADILASLLALLSHPTEYANAGKEADPEQDSVKTSRSVIFIIDEFDLFASHPRQTLLYNLFDIAQARKAPIAVLGLTTKIDVTESLEKRVKSRFSHRYVHLALPRTYTTFLNILRTALYSSDDTTNPSTPPTPTPLHTAWTAYISALLAHAPISTFLLRTFHHSKSIPQLLSSLLPAFLLTPATLPPTPATIHAQLLSLLPPDNKLHLLHSLSTLALALLISAARLDIVLSTDAVTFAMAFDEYVSLTTRTRVVAGASGAGAMAGLAGGGRAWPRDVAMGAWEELCDVGLVVAVAGEGKGGEGRLWRCDVALEEIGAECKGELGAMGRWCREMAL